MSKDIMCSQKEAEQAMEAVLYRKDADGHTVIGKLIDEHLQRKANEIVSKLTIRFGITIIGLSIVAAGAWFTLKNEVDNNTENRFTGQQGQLLELQIEQNTTNITQLRSDYKDDISEVKNLLQDIRNSL